MYNNYYRQDDRLIFPFLTGALVGGAAVGLTRPRPIYATAPLYPQPYPYPYPQPYPRPYPQAYPYQPYPYYR